MNSSIVVTPHHPPVDPNRAITADHNKQYPRQVWWFVASFITLVSLFQFASWTLSKLSTGRASDKKQEEDTEAGESPGTRSFSWRRIPLALVNAYRVVAFRCTLQFGQSYTLNFAEVFVTCAYIVAIFTWEFVNSTSRFCQTATAPQLANSASDSDDVIRAQAGYQLLGWPGGCNWCQSVPSDHSLGHEEQRSGM